MSGRSPVLSAATPDALVALIGSTERRLVVVAPAISMEVARAIVEKWAALGPEHVSVTLDVDPEVYRLGYGDAKALDLLETTGSGLGGMLQCHTGVRVGLIAADDRVLVYAPVPELVEAGPRSPEAPNAVLFDALPAALSDALGIGAGGAADQEIGLDKAARHEIEAVQRDLQVNPPQQFDLTRHLRVFNAAFQFVELEMSGTSIARRTARIPNHLLGVVDPATRDDLRTVLNIMPPDHALSGADLSRKRQRLERRYLRVIPSFGLALSRANKQAFLKDVEVLKSGLETFRAKVEKELDQEIEKRVDELTKALLPRLCEAPPEEWLLPTSPAEREAACETCLREDLALALGRAADYVSGMSLRVVFKDVTYESLRDGKFMNAARKAFPDLPQLHAEFEAARASGSPANTMADASGAGA